MKVYFNLKINLFYIIYLKKKKENTLFMSWTDLNR